MSSSLCGVAFAALCVASAVGQAPSAAFVSHLTRTDRVVWVASLPGAPFAVAWSRDWSHGAGFWSPGDVVGSRAAAPRLSAHVVGVRTEVRVTPLTAGSTCGLGLVTSADGSPRGAVAMGLRVPADIAVLGRPVAWTAHPVRPSFDRPSPPPIDLAAPRPGR